MTPKAALIIIYLKAAALTDLLAPFSFLGLQVDSKSLSMLLTLMTRKERNVWNMRRRLRSLHCHTRVQTHANLIMRDSLWFKHQHRLTHLTVGVGQQAFKQLAVIRGFCQEDNKIYIYSKSVYSCLKITHAYYDLLINYMKPQIW